MKDSYLEEALRQYESGIESNEPFYMDASTLLDIQAYYARENRRYDAERCLRFALRLHPDNEEVLVAKAYQLKNAGRWSEADSIVDGLTDQGDREVQLYYMERHIAAGQLEEAEDLLRENLPDAKVEAEAAQDWFVDFGEILLDYGYAGRALKWLRKAPPSYHEAKHLLELLADAGNLTGETTESCAAANRLIDNDPYDAVSWCQLAELQQNNGQYAESLESCDYALAIDPSQRQAMNMKVYDLFALNRTEEGFAACHDYMRQQPDDYTLPMYAGEQLYSLEGTEEEKRNRLQKAEKYLRRALMLCPIENADRSRVSNGLALTLCRLGRVGEAEEQLLSAVSAGLSRYEAYTQLAVWLQDAGKSAEALGQLRKAFPLRGLSGNDPDGFSVVRQLEEMKMYAEAADLWETFSAVSGKTAIPSFSNKEMYAMVACAMYRLRNAKGFSDYVPAAVRECPFALLERFQSVFPDVPLGNLPLHLLSLAFKAGDGNGID